MPEEVRITVHLLPSLIPPGALRGGVAVVVDVLRATTAMMHALAAGCEAIVPCGEIDEARRVEAGLPTGSTLLAGERQGVPIEGFDLGNSPSSFSPEVCRGKTLVMTTTNGTRALLASLEAERVFIAAFPTLTATVETIRAAGRPIHIVCSGTDGLVSFEDTLLAGAISAKWIELGFRQHEGSGAMRTLEDLVANDSAWIALQSWLSIGDAVKTGERTLFAMLSSGRGGRRVTELGLAPDIVDASRIDRFDFAAELRRETGPIRIVRI